MATEMVMKLSIAQRTALAAIDAGTIFYDPASSKFRQTDIPRNIARSREILVDRPNLVLPALHRRGLIAFDGYKVVRA